MRAPASGGGVAPRALNVLLIEDKRPDAELCLAVLAEAGYAVSSQIVETRAEAEAALREQAYDLVLADYRLPGWLGTEVMELLRQLKLEVPVIMITGVLGDEGAVDCMQHGVRDYVLKNNLVRLPSAVRKALEDARQRQLLRAAETEYQRLFQRSVAGIFSNTLDGRLLKCNAANARIYGYDSPEQMMQECCSIRDFYAVPEDRDRFLAALLREGRVSNWECCHRRRDGSLVWILENATLIRDEATGADLVEGTLVDISERKVAEDAIRRSEEEFRSRIEHALLPVYTADLERDRLVTMNRALRKLLGLDLEESASSLQLSALFADPEVYQILVRELMATGGTVEKDVRWRPPRGGPLLTVRITQRLYRAIDGSSSVDGLAVDITAARRMEEQLRQAQKMEAVGQLAGGIAHDFNNMLMVIGSYAEMLGSTGLPPEQSRHHREQILKTVRKASTLTRQLLAFSRRQVLCPTLLDLNTALLEHCKMLPRLIGEHIRVVAHASARKPQIEADPVQMDQVIMNLAVNARDAMPQGGLLTLETSDVVLERPHEGPSFSVPAGRYVLLAVSDTGCGMDAETQTHIFEPFFTTKGKGVGTGLGLPMVYGIVKQSGGFISVYSEKGIGTTFKIYWPLAQKPGEAREEIVTPAAAGGAETLLLVEDEEALRPVIRDYLQARGYKVLDAGNGVEALRLAAQAAGDLDVLITDVVLPGMQGTDVARQVRELNAGVKVLFVSGYADRALQDRGLLQGNASFLQKPFSLGTLAGAIRSLLDGSPATVPEAAAHA